MNIRTLTSGLVTLMISCGVHAADGDVAGSADHPLVGRFDNSVISYYEAVDFDAYYFIAGPVQQRGETGTGQQVEGSIIRIAYVLPTGTTPLQVVRNFEQRLEENSLEIDYSCSAQECGLNSFTSTTEMLPIPYMDVDSWNFNYLAAHGVVDGSEVFVTVLASVGGDGMTRCQVIIGEEEAMTYQIVDAEALAKGLAADGHIAIYNIYFDTDESRLKPESAGALREIAELMKVDQGLELIVVGHTDNVGELPYNENLSVRRADAVVAELTGAYGVNENRLTSAGVGMYAPVASNQQEAGRALNRRVELVRR